MNIEQIKNTLREFQAENIRKFKNTQAEFKKTVSYKKKESVKQKIVTFDCGLIDNESQRILKDCKRSTRRRAMRRLTLIFTQGMLSNVGLY